MPALYFGYGSNLDASDWLRWVDRRGFGADCLRSEGPGALPDEAMAFDYLSTSRNCGALDVSPCVGGIVDDWRFEPTAEGWEALDAGEGHPRFYRREDMVAIGPDCRAVTPAAEDRRGRPRLVRRLPSRHADECPARNPQPEVSCRRARRGERNRSHHLRRRPVGTVL